MRSIWLFIPNFITSLNLLCGALAIVFVLEGMILLPVLFLFIAAICDFLDGFMAKLLNATTKLGKQLDSLADIVSFGFAPSVLLYKSMVSILLEDRTDILMRASSFQEYLIIYLPFVFLIAAAFRLARFNISSSVSSDFEGLPVPAATLFVVSYWLILHSQTSGELQRLLSNSYFIVLASLFFSFLMISKIPMLSLKFEGTSVKNNIWRYALILGSIFLIVIYRLNALHSVMFYYLLLSITKILFKRFRQNP